MEQKFVINFCPSTFEKSNEDSDNAQNCSEEETTDHLDHLVSTPFVDIAEMQSSVETKASSPEVSCWTDPVTKLLLNNVKELYGKVGKSSSLKNKTKLWQVIAKNLEKEGYRFSPVQVESKYRGLLRQYKKVKLDNSNNKRSRVTCVYLSELEEIMGLERGINTAYTPDKVQAVKTENIPENEEFIKVEYTTENEEFIKTEYIIDNADGIETEYSLDNESQQLLGSSWPAKSTQETISKRSFAFFDEPTTTSSKARDAEGKKLLKKFEEISQRKEARYQKLFAFLEKKELRKIEKEKEKKQREKRQEELGNRIVNLLEKLANKVAE